MYVPEAVFSRLPDLVRCQARLRRSLARLNCFSCSGVCSGQSSSNVIGRSLRASSILSCSSVKVTGFDKSSLLLIIVFIPFKVDVKKAHFCSPCCSTYIISHPTRKINPLFQKFRQIGKFLRKNLVILMIPIFPAYNFGKVLSKLYIDFAAWICYYINVRKKLVKFFKKFFCGSETFS